MQGGNDTIYMEGGNYTIDMEGGDDTIAIEGGNDNFANNYVMLDDYRRTKIVTIYFGQLKTSWEGSTVRF